MNWDQIERKWDEMTRRVQSPSMPVVNSQAKPPPNQAITITGVDPVRSPDQSAGLATGNPNE